MSKQSIYEQQARLNEENARKAHTESPEWAIIMYFYAALHWVNDYAHRRGEISKLEDITISPSPHNRRKIYVKRVSKYKGNEDELLESYEYLFDESMIARYLENGDYQSINMTSREYYKRCNFKEHIASLETLKRMLRG